MPSGSPGCLSWSSRPHQGKPYMSQGTEGLTGPDQPLPSCPRQQGCSPAPHSPALPMGPTSWPGLSLSPFLQPCPAIPGLCLALVPLSRVSSRPTSPSADLGQGSVTVPHKLGFLLSPPHRVQPGGGQAKAHCSPKDQLTTGFRPECQGIVWCLPKMAGSCEGSRTCMWG